VLVLGGDPVGELVQVRLADDRVARLLEPDDRWCRPLGRMVAEDRGAVGRYDSGRVEEVLDREADPFAGGFDLRDEGVKRGRCR
jgi:hypothetical protein